MGWLAVALLAATCAAAAPQGATLVFPSGGTLRGTLVHADSATVSVEADGGTVEFPRSALSAVRLGPTPDSEFAARAARTDPRDPAALWGLARWADAHGLPATAAREAASVLALAPDHARARAFLGYERVDGRWLRGDALLRARGLVPFEGRWVTRAERADELDARARAEERADERRAAAREARLIAVELARLGVPRPAPAPVGIVKVVGYGPVVVLPKRRIELARPRGPMTGPEPWRPQPFHPYQPVLGLPVLDPPGTFGLDPLR